MEWASLFWKTGFGFMLVSLSVFMGYLWATVENIGDILGSVRGVVRVMVRNLLTGLAIQEIETLVQNLNERLSRLSDQIPRLLESMSSIADSAQRMRSEKQPTAHNNHEIASAKETGK
jgi:methyl-accepting chemotaxis protein